MLLSIIFIILICIPMFMYIEHRNYKNKMENTLEDLYRYIEIRDKSIKNLQDTINTLNKRLGDIPKPIFFNNISIDNLKIKLKEKFGIFNYRYLDREYKLTNCSEVDRLLNAIKHDYKYVGEFYDCDDIAIRILGLCSIPEWSSIPMGLGVFKKKSNCDDSYIYHMVVIFLDDNYKFWKIEGFTIKDIPTEWKLVFVMI